MNVLNTPIKRQRLADWIKTHDPTLGLNLRSKDTKGLKLKGQNRIVPANSNHKKAQSKGK